MEHQAVEINKPYLSTSVIEALEQWLKKDNGGKICNYEIENATAKGENYVGLVYRIKANVTDKVGNSKEFHCIVKVPPQSPSRREQFFVRPCFLREALAYKEFLPMIEEFQKKRGVTRHEQKFHEYPDCYSALTDDLDEAILMEDLSQRGFRLFNRFDEIDYQHVTLVMRAYAKLHAVSLAIKEQEPSKLEQFKEIVDVLEQRKNNEALKAFFEHLKENALASLNAQEDAKYFGILQRYFDRDTFFALLLKYINPKDCEPYAVICHGDCWNNNILYSYQDHDNVIDACLIDWQLMRYASPIVDLVYFIFSATTKEFRQKHYGEMLNVYYEELSEHLTRLGSNPNNVFPRHIFEHQLKNKGAVALLFAMIVLPITTLKSEDTPDLEKLSERINSGNTTDLKRSGFLGSGNKNTFETRMRDVVIDIIDHGYISDE